MVSFPNAKINLGLDIIERRDDGFHNISSCFYPIGLCDVLEMIEADQFQLTLSGWHISGDVQSNLIAKAYRLLRKDFELPGIQLHLHKNIPLEAGLGGGSSDATFTLRMLSEHFDLYLSDELLADYAGQLGSDCPFFVNNRPALVSGRGDHLEEISIDLQGYHLFLVKPDVAISTKEAYQGIRPRQPSRDIRSILENEDIGSWKDWLKNDFEPVVFEKYPELCGIKDSLYDMGAVYVSLTGSGSALYGVFRSSPPGKDHFPEEYFRWRGAL